MNQTKHSPSLIHHTSKQGENEAITAHTWNILLSFISCRIAYQYHLKRQGTWDKAEAARVSHPWYGPPLILLQPLATVLVHKPPDLEAISFSFSLPFS